MSLTKLIAKHFREVHFGGNWTWSNLKDILADVTVEQATAKVGSFNTIATLVYHINYYVTAIIPVLEGTPLNSIDKESFDHPPFLSQADWENYLQKTRDNAEKLARLIEALPDEQLTENFADEKYGNYYRNLHGLIEHTHYHLGQIALLKKMLRGDLQDPGLKNS